MTYSYGRALQQSALKHWSKDIKDISGTQKVLIIVQIYVRLQLEGNGLKILKFRAKFIYLISPNKIYHNFYRDLKKVLNTNKVKYFQLRLKKTSKTKIINISKEIIKICKTSNVKFIINDDPLIAKKVGADGCHLGQKDLHIKKAKKILKNKIIGITCNNSIKKAKEAIKIMLIISL